MNRGVDRRNIYLSDADRRIFLHLLAEVTREMGWRMFAFVLMTNHYHLVFEIPGENLSKGMQLLESKYARAFNRRNNRLGALFQSRFKSELIDSERYLLQAVRYTVLNPVRAGMVATPDLWPWSSYRATAGMASVPDWLDLAPVLDRFSPMDWHRAAVEFQAFVNRTVADLDHPETWIVGHETTITVDLTAVLSLIEEVYGPAVKGRRRGSTSRQLFAATARDLGASLKEIGEHLSVGKAAANTILRIGERRRAQDEPFAQAFVQLKNQLSQRDGEP
jgi:REP element-mobilizing transposase RayT